MKLVPPCMSLSKASCIKSSVRVSMLEVASSRMSMGGRVSMTRVMHKKLLLPLTYIVLMEHGVGSPCGSLR